MKILKLNYYHGEIYEKYKINSVLSLLVDKHKFQNESIDFNELSSKKNNYSIMALLGSQLKNLNDDIYKDIDTNDIILALSKLKKIDEQIVINENENENYILELAEQLYYEYSQKGLISNSSPFHLNDKKTFMSINLELMNEINNGIRNYEGKIHYVRSFSGDKLKRDAFHSDGDGYLDSDKVNSFLSENNMYYNIKPHKYSDGERNGLNSNIYNNVINRDLMDRNEPDSMDEVNENVLKCENDHNANRINNEYEKYIARNGEKRNAIIEEETYENCRNFTKDHLSSGNSIRSGSDNRNNNNSGNNNKKSNVNYCDREGENSSTCCNSVENINDDIHAYRNVEKNSANEHRGGQFINTSHFHSGGKHIFNDRMKMDYLKRKTHYEKVEEEEGEENEEEGDRSGGNHRSGGSCRSGGIRRSGGSRRSGGNRRSGGSRRSERNNRIGNNNRIESNNRRTIVGNTNLLTNRINEEKVRSKNYYDMDTNRINAHIHGYSHVTDKYGPSEYDQVTDECSTSGYGRFNDKYGTNKTRLHRDEMGYDINNNDLKGDTQIGADNSPPTYDSRYNINLRRGSKNHIFSKNTKNTMNSVLENIDKAEQEIVNSHLKNSLTKNEYVARRMSSILLNPMIPSKEVFNNRNSYDNHSMNKFVNRNIQNCNSDISLNKYSTFEQRKNFTADTNNNSSFIISTVNKRNSSEEDSFNVFGNFEDKKLPISSRNNFTQDNYLIDRNINYNILERNNSNTPLNIDNLSNFSRNVPKSIESNQRMYTNKYSRALDINDLNSNTSRNHVNSSNSLKSDLIMMRDNYAKMLERSKSLTSQIHRVPIASRYLKAKM
ncbi:conserved Plasmodium protein, unknown function [Plasmodium ovale]|uniref:Uncharacterized protein n=2 Tax=Plasmodium ovale TaxID=36330 RepID=A0A1A8VUR1_PLAOA|nr:conserved Plasmodium protein, unknown function [Plasmodium ovale curtisi]SBS89703.1 conserved Plasmodium protein, unknown function [Plasmodium ovale curtisi]SCP04279.1 conserved Plasmodium protein, unknown function [Plasmodium ovale]